MKIGLVKYRVIEANIYNNVKNILKIYKRFIFKQINVLLYRKIISKYKL